jgi:hypothetical protein
MKMMRSLHVPKVGFLPVSNDIFGQELAENVRRVVLERLQVFACEVLAPTNGVLTDANAARKAAHDCLASDAIWLW